MSGKNANQDNSETTQNQMNHDSAAISKSNFMTRLKSIRSPIAANGKPKPSEPTETIAG